jgi:hypothetical protein
MEDMFVCKDVKEVLGGRNLRVLIDQFNNIPPN